MPTAQIWMPMAKQITKITQMAAHPTLPSKGEHLQRCCAGVSPEKLAHVGKI